MALTITETKEKDIDRQLQNAIAARKVITFKTYLLSDYGEAILKKIASHILNLFQRQDLFDLVYTTAKELIINATKANFKRVLFQNMGLDINQQNQYQTGMSEFKDNLTEQTIAAYSKDFHKYELPVVATFYYNEYVLNIKVKNNFTLLPWEEARIRDKFNKATSFSSLIDFYMEYGDNSEGAGMGLTMVGILLDQSNIDKHCFTLYTSEKYKETIAKIEIPLSEDYIPKRKIFEKELIKRNVSPEELRNEFSYNYKHFNVYDITSQP